MRWYLIEDLTRSLRGLKLTNYASSNFTAVATCLSWPYYASSYKYRNSRPYEHHRFPCFFFFRTKNYPGQYKCALRAKCFAMRVAWPIVHSGQVWGKVKILGHAESFSPLFKTPEIVGRTPFSFPKHLLKECLLIFILFNKAPVQTADHMKSMNKEMK